MEKKVVKKDQKKGPAELVNNHKTLKNQLISISVLFVNECAGPATSVRAADPGNDQTENQKGWRDQTVGVQHEGRIIGSVHSHCNPPIF